jgi:hypothetical protein
MHHHQLKEKSPKNVQQKKIHSMKKGILFINFQKCIINTFVFSANFKRARYHRENPFIFFEEKDIKGFWQEIR